MRRIILSVSIGIALGTVAGCGALIGVDDLSFSGSGGQASSVAATTNASATTSSGTGGTSSGGSGGAQTSAGTGGGGGNSMVEVCDGIDNDLDGVPDEGCPFGILVPEGDIDGHPEFGDPDNSDSFLDACPSGMAMYGIDGWMSSLLRSVQGQCAAFSFNIDTSGPTYSYQLTRGFQEPLAPRGNVGTGSPYSLICPDDGFIVGIEMGLENTDGPFDSIAVHCAEFLIVDNGTGFVLEYASTVVLSQGMTVMPVVDLLTAPSLVDRYVGSASNRVESFGIGASQVVLQLSPP